MTLTELDALIAGSPSPVIILEGRRGIPADFYARAVAVGRFLAERYPGARFRSGNAEGSDEAFSEGVAAVDPGRLQVIAPYQSHRRKYRIPDAAYASPEEASPLVEAEIARKTVEASPKNRGMVERRGGSGQVAAKAAYLIRDTMKVTGFSDEYPPATVALFYIDEGDPMAGGTGHTVRVCRQEGVPVVFQDEWSKWIE
jgi:hypothetical protein